jgi:hypothetical protein
MSKRIDLSFILKTVTEMEMATATAEEPETLISWQRG